MKRSTLVSICQMIFCPLMIWFEQMLFNRCISDVFGLPHLTYWEMFGIDLFFVLLFSNWVKTEAYTKIVDHFGE